MHKRHKHQLHSSSARANAVISTVYRLMQEELSQAACERWCTYLNKELGCATFGPSDISSVPLMWVPAKPKLTRALLDEFGYGDLQASPTKKSIGTERTISKLLTRNAIERLCRNKGIEWLKASGELALEQLNDATRLNQTLSRVAFDLLVYVHARAVELQRENEADIVLALHSSDQTVVGRAMRGSGVVFCEGGRKIFARAVSLVRDALSDEVTS